MKSVASGVQARVSISAVLGATEVMSFYKTAASGCGAFSFPTHSAIKPRNGWGTRPFYKGGNGWQT